MSFKKLIIPIIILFLIILLLVAILILGSKPQAGQPQEPNIQEPEEKIIEKQPNAIKEDIVIKEFDDSFLDIDDLTAVPSKDEADKAELQLFIRNFLEDFGSFSFNGGYDHIEDLYDKMTVDFRAYVQDWIAQDPARQLSSEFYSIQTTVSEVKIDEFFSAKAKLMADVARVETKAPEYYGRRFIGQAEVNAEKIGGEWKVAGVYWQ